MCVAEQYTYQVRWSEPDNEYVATIAEFPSLSWLASTWENALLGAVARVSETLEDMAEDGDIPPEPFAQVTSYD
jgi:predicted RNase H-like HicB family nuclease